MLDGNILRIVSSEVVEAARDSLLIGQIYKRLQAQGPDVPGAKGYVDNGICAGLSIALSSPLQSRGGPYVCRKMS
jgi:hypothetical protein